jgi:hypothetical protein
VHDGIALEQRGLPTVTVCTLPFESTSRASAVASGWPDYPVLYTDHPISSVADDVLAARGAALADAAARLLQAARPAPAEAGRA